MNRAFAFALTATALVAACSSADDDTKSPATVDAGAPAIDPNALSGGQTTVFDTTSGAYGQMAPTVKGDRATAFTLGHAIFDENWVTAPATTEDQDGVGPRFNQRSCSSCHSKDGRAAPFDHTGAQLNFLFRLSIPGADAHAGPNGDPIYGTQLRPVAILGIPADGVPHTTFTEVPGTYGDGTPYSLQKPTHMIDGWGDGAPAAGLMISPRVGPITIGLGLLEAIPESAILAHVKSGNPDNVVGKPNHVWDPESNTTVLGRFGWKANVATVKQQTAGALQGDMGVTSSLNPTETCTPTMAQCLAAPSGGTPEIDDEKLDALVFYMQTLAVPARRGLTDTNAQHGAQLFDQMGCSSCHTTTFQTDPNAALPEVANQTIHPYTDLLLHDMGAELADNRPDFEASGSEWRTPALWGIGLLETVNGHSLFLHDARARNFQEAILWHGGEATAARERFRNAAAADRDALVTFLESLAKIMRRTPFLAAAVLALGITAFLACDDNTGTPPTDYTALIKDLTENVVIPEQNQFATDADALSTAATALTPDQGSLTALQQAWRTARASFRVLDAVQIGPIADDGIAARIDSGPASATDIDAAINGTAAVNVPALGGQSKGFLGLQYLIFSTDALAKLQADTSGRRKQFITGMAAEIASSAHQVVDGWTPGKGGFQTQVETAGAGSTHYPTQRAVVDDFVGGVGYAFEVIVGIRLALPLGRKTGGSPDPTQDITSLSDNDDADLNSSLKGILAVYNANAGFSVRLKAKNVQLDTAMTSQLQDCGTKIAAIPAPFVSSLTANTAVVQAAYTACDTSKGTWNSSATPALGATVKPGDNDGD